VLEELGADNFDIILASDTDELIDEGVFQKAIDILAKADVPLINVNQKAYAYRLNLRGTYSAGPKICRYAHYKHMDLSIPRGENGYMVHGGWHFSYMTDPDGVLYKCRSFSHADEQHDVHNSEEAVAKVMRGLVSHKEEIDDSFPKYLREHPEKFSHLLA
jgi:hypothetical protein